MRSTATEVHKRKAPNTLCRHENWQ